MAEVTMALTHDELHPQGRTKCNYPFKRCLFFKVSEPQSTDSCYNLIDLTQKFLFSGMRKRPLDI